MTTKAFNKLFDYHKSLDIAYKKGLGDGYHNGYYGNLGWDTVAYRQYKNPERQKWYDKGYQEGYHEGWLES